jgi:hypothetical protein
MVKNQDKLLKKVKSITKLRKAKTSNKPDHPDWVKFFEDDVNFEDTDPNKALQFDWVFVSGDTNPDAIPLVKIILRLIKENDIPLGVFGDLVDDVQESQLTTCVTIAIKDAWENSETLTVGGALVTAIEKIQRTYLKFVTVTDSDDE